MIVTLFILFIVSIIGYLIIDTVIPDYLLRKTIDDALKQVKNIEDKKNE